MTLPPLESKQTGATVCTTHFPIAQYLISLSRRTEAVNMQCCLRLSVRIRQNK